MSDHIKPIQLYALFNNDVRPSLDALYSDGLQQYWDWLGEDFYPVFGVDNFGQAAAADLGDNPTETDIQYYQAANSLSEILNTLNQDVFNLKRENGLSLADGNWPGDNLEKYNYAYYEQKVVPVLVQILDSLKLVQENVLVSAPDGFNNWIGSGPFKFGQSPPPELPSLVEDVFAQLPGFLKAFGIQVSLKKEIPPAAPTSTSGANTIVSDVDLESSLGLHQDGPTHYIGFLEPAERSNGARSAPYLPVRLAPTAEKLSNGWSDGKYSLIANNGKLIKPPGKNKVVNGIEVPLGLEITIVDVVPSETGLWVGFVSTDSKLKEDQVPTSAHPAFESRWDFLITARQKRLLYTKAEYVRIKDSALKKSPDPYISEKVLLGGRKDSVGNTVDSVLSIKGSERVDPKNSQTWVKLDPEEVVLKYYNFEEHNDKIYGQNGEEDVYYNTDSFLKAPTLKLSQGFYYFISGEAKRKTEAEVINESSNDVENSTDALNEAKASAGAASIAAVKQEAWKNLLKYFNKQDINTSHLYEKYFILVDRKLEANPSTPNNQKALFAIRASYIDSLLESFKPYTNNFDNNDPFYSGRSYAVSMPLNELKGRVEYLVETLKDIKNTIAGSSATIENPSGLSFDMETQIQALEDLLLIFDDFFTRQSWPRSTNRSLVHQMASVGVNDSNSKHIIQIGLADNKEIGGSVRETVSYVLFSPDPDSLSSAERKNIDLFSFDPYLTEKELDGSKELKRSAISLDLGLPLLRRQLSGVYSSRALHLLLAHDKIKGRSSATGGDSDLKSNWREFLSMFFVPPVRIYLSKNPSSVDISKLDCEEIIRQLDNSGPTVGPEEKLLQEKLYSSPECMEQYYERFNKKTSATSPEFSKKQLESKAELGKLKGKLLDNEYIKVLYTQFFNVIDFDSIMAMIMACLYKELGVQFTAEALCEAAIAEMIKEFGSGPIEQAMLAKALMSPDSPAAQQFFAFYNSAPSVNTGPGLPLDSEDPDGIVLDPSFNGLPIATSMKMSSTPPALSIINITKELEAAGQQVNLVPGPRPDAGKQVQLPPGSTGVFSLFGVEEVDGYAILPEYYTEQEIEREKNRLMEMGFTEDQARAELVRMGYLVPDMQQYEPLLGGDDFSSSIEKSVNNLRFTGVADASFAEDVRTVSQAAEGWVNYARQFMDLQAMCELLVGDLLEGLKELLKDPGAFFDDGSGNGWFESFWQKLKKQFTPPTFTFKFPDSLMVDNQLGDLDKQIYKAILSMVAMILGQIVDLLIKDALEKCLEENTDSGPAGSPLNRPDSIPYPVLSGASLPSVDGVPNVDIVAWMQDTIDTIKNNSILCALLRGDATKFTLTNILTHTRENWPQVYSAGVDSIYEIRVAFKKIGDSIDLDICNFMDPASKLPLVDDMCDAIYDRDSRCAELQSGGLTEEECQEQIDKEIEELRQKVIGLTGLSLFDANPLTNAMPPLCGENGSFVVPPGVEYNMELVTDNILSTVKGSLLIDMNSLKFFSTPPRALLAASDPEELKKAHEMFTTAITDPYKKECLALILDPSAHDNSISAIPSVINQEVYPITYNKSFHFGNLSTFSFEPELQILSQEKLDEIFQQAQEEIDEEAIYAKTQFLLEQEQETINSLLYLREELSEETAELQQLAKCEAPPGKVSIPSWTCNERKKALQDHLNLIGAIEDFATTLDLSGVFDPTSRGGQDLEDAIPSFFAGVTIPGELTEILDDYKINATLNARNVYLSYISNNLDERYNTLVGEAIIDVGRIKESLIPTEVLEEHFLLSDEKFAEKVKAYMGTTKKLRIDESFYSKNAITPISYATQIKTGTITEKLNILRTVPGSSKKKKEFLEGHLSELISSTPDPQEVVDKIYSDFTTDLQALYLDKLIIEPSDIFKPLVGAHTGLFSVGGRNNKVQGFPGNLDNYNSYIPMLKRSYNLTDKLYNINPLVDYWYLMCCNYTGLRIGLDDVDQTTFPDFFLDLIDTAVFDAEDPTTVYDSLGHQIRNALKYSLTFSNLFEYDNFLDMMNLLNDFTSFDGSWDGVPIPGMYESPNPGGGEDVETDIYVEEMTTGEDLLDEWDTSIEEGFHTEEFRRSYEHKMRSQEQEELFLSLRQNLENIYGWYNWLCISPGLRSLVPIMKELKLDAEDLEAAGPGTAAHYTGRSKNAIYEDVNHNVVRAFMELTLAEATGLESQKIKKLFPSITHITPTTSKVILGAFEENSEGTACRSFKFNVFAPDHDETKIGSFSMIDDHRASAGTTHQFYPHFLVFEKSFRDPSLPFNQDDESIINHFSAKEDLVNKELYDYLRSFPKFVGFGDSPADQMSNSWIDIINMENDYNFNPNILKYNLPFSEVKSGDGLGAQDLTAEITNIFSTTTPPGGSMDALIDQFNITQEDKKLVNQNVITPAGENILTQFEEIKNASHFVKAKIPEAALSSPGAIIQPEQIQEEEYNFNYTKKLPSDVQDLLRKLYPDEGSVAESIINNYNSNFVRDEYDSVTPTPYPNMLHFDSKNFLSVDTYNFKSQIFGRLLTHKFFEKFDEFYDPTTAPSGDSEYVEQNKENIKNNMNFILSSYGYSAMQYAYVNQMFSKFKHSRLHRRGFMKSLWKKILKTPSTSKVDPRCQMIFDELGTPSIKDLDKTETDFFNIEVVKPKIMNFFKNSLCQDVFKNSVNELGSTQVALIEGAIILIAKVYSLEMCLASVVAWDSLDVEDVFQEAALKSVVVNNIKKDFDMSFISTFANDIIAKENADLTYVEVVKMLDGRSPIEYLIEREIVSISAAIKDIFINSAPFNTSLELTTLKNSDPDFVEEYNQIFGEENSNSEELAEIHSSTDVEYVVHASLEDNIYTMNFGSGAPPGPPILSVAAQGANTANSGLNSAESDIYGHFTKKNGNKNYLHSLPQNYYFAHGGDVASSFSYESISSKSSSNTFNKAAIPNLKLAVAPQEDLVGRIVEYQQKQEVFDKFKTDLFKYENFQEFTIGNELNSRFGNVLFQPYVKIRDYAPDEERGAAGQYIANLYNEYDNNGEPCEGATLFASYDINDLLAQLEPIESARDGNNILNCRLRGNVPLASWSYFYSNVFLPFIENHTSPEGHQPFKLLFSLYGFAPFFKNISFGIRMTYVNSFSLFTTDSIDTDTFIQSAFGGQGGVVGDGPGIKNTLKNAKCIFSQRLYTVHDPYHGLLYPTLGAPTNTVALREIQIPIAEVERSIEKVGNKFVVGSTGRTYQTYDYKLLGVYAQDSLSKDSTIDDITTLSGRKALESMAYNFKQFFYGNVANDMLRELKATPEFKLMYDYLFPMKRYMALPFVMASDGLSKFIPDPTIVLDETKNSLKNIIFSLVNSTDYTTVPDPVKNALANAAAFRDMGTTGKEEDLTKELLRIIFRTPFLVLKGFVEITDPAVRAAKTIIDIANTIVFTTLAAIKAAVNTALQIIETGILTGRQVVMQLKMELGAALEMLKSLKPALGPAQDSVVINVSAEDPISKWKAPDLEIKDLPPEVENDMTDEEKENWNSFQEQFQDLLSLVQKLEEANTQLSDLEAEKAKLVAYKEGALKDAERKLKKFFKSPYLLPGMWAALMPPMMPLGGGIVPPPFPGGPFPSTVPGMIYIALLLIDAIEEKTHDDMQKLDDDSPNCEDQL